MKNNTLKIFYSIYPPSFWSTIRHLLLMESTQALLIMAGSCCCTSFLILASRASKLCGRGRKTLDFKNPHSQKSKGFRQGEWAGYLGPLMLFLETTLSPIGKIKVSKNA